LRGGWWVGLGGLIVDGRRERGRRWGEEVVRGRDE
jgi:hypothetical protein